TRGVAMFVIAVWRFISSAALRPRSNAGSEADRSANILSHANIRAAAKSDLLIAALKLSTACLTESIGAGCAEQQLVDRLAITIAASPSRRSFTDGVWIKVFIF